MQDNSPGKKLRENSDASRENRECRDSAAYVCLLKNELLQAGIDDMKGQTDDRRALAPLHGGNLFQYSTPTKRHNLTSPYSMSPVSARSQKLLRSPRKATRKISRIPFKVRYILWTYTLADIDLCLVTEHFLLPIRY